MKRRTAEDMIQLCIRRGLKIVSAIVILRRVVRGLIVLLDHLVGLKVIVVVKTILLLYFHGHWIHVGVMHHVRSRSGPSMALVAGSARSLAFGWCGSREGLVEGIMPRSSILGQDNSMQHDDSSSPVRSEHSFLRGVLFLGH